MEEEARELGISGAAGAAGGTGRDTTTGHRSGAEVSRLKRELAEACLESDIFKNPPRTLRRRSCPVHSDDDAALPVPSCHAVWSPLGVPKRVPRLAHSPPLEAHPGERTRLEVAIRAAHVCTCQTYGPEQLQAELRDDGIPAGVGRIKLLRKKPGLRKVTQTVFGRPVFVQRCQ